MNDISSHLRITILTVVTIRLKQSLVCYQCVSFSIFVTMNQSSHHMHGGVNEESKVHGVTIEQNHITHLFFAVMDCLLSYGNNVIIHCTQLPFDKNSTFSHKN